MNYLSKLPDGSKDPAHLPTLSQADLTWLDSDFVQGSYCNETSRPGGATMIYFNLIRCHKAEIPDGLHVS